jgi:UV excision repair protein RAD23
MGGEGGEEASGDEDASRTRQRPASGATTATRPAPGEDPLAFLRTQPQFAQMRSLLQQNPTLLAPLLQQLAQSNPQLLQLINEHQNEFYNMINEPMDAETGNSAATAGGAPGGAVVPPAGGAPGSAGGARNPNSQYISVTPQEREAIDRVCILINVLDLSGKILTLIS